MDITKHNNVGNYNWNTAGSVSIDTVCDSVSYMVSYHEYWENILVLDPIDGKFYRCFKPSVTRIAGWTNVLAQQLDLVYPNTFVVDYNYPKSLLPLIPVGKYISTFLIFLLAFLFSYSPVFSYLLHS